MFTSLNVEITHVGFSSFDSYYSAAPSDRHCLIWAEFINFSILGKHIPVFNQQIEADRVKSRDPRSRKQCHKMVKRCFCSQNMFCMKENLEKQSYNFVNGTNNTAKEIFIPKYQRKFNPFHILVRETKATVAKKMGKIFARGQPWSPEYKQLVKTIKFWIQIVRLKKNVNTSHTILKPLSKLINIKCRPNNILLQQAKAKLKEARKEYYNNNKNNFKKWRLQFDTSLIDALAEEEEAPCSRIIACMKREKHSKKLGEIARIIRRKKLKEIILHALALHPNGESYKCNSQDTMIPAMSRSNILHQQQYQDTRFVKYPLLNNFGYLANK